MLEQKLLNDFSKRVADRLLEAYPEWEEFVFYEKGGLLEVCIPSPENSKADSIIIFTTKDNDLWVRFSPPYMCYGLDDEEEMLRIVEELLTDKALFVVIMEGDKWAGTTLTRPEAKIPLEAGQRAQIVSWSGNLDRELIA
jgi:hypothetical protein